MSKLKACPFCGEVEDLQINDDSDKEGTMYVWCYACNVSGPSAVMPKDVWNHRPIEDSLKAHVLEVLAKQISRTYRDGYDSDYKYMRDKDRYVMSQEDWDSKCRAEARALLGWDNDNNDNNDKEK